MQDPSTAAEWLAVARERGLDAGALLPARAQSVAPSYLAGYAVESALKAYLQSRGISRPSSGPEGHNLRALWKSSGLRLSDLKDSDGSAAYFINDWDTRLRYQSTRPATALGSEQLVSTATRLVGYLSNLTKRRK